MTTATETHSGYVILIAFLRQKWLRERASMLRLYVHCLSRNNFTIVYISTGFATNNIKYADLTVRQVTYPWHLSVNPVYLPTE
jgi:hypothetical protein